MSEYYVYWRAQLIQTGPGAEARFMRVVEELGAYPKVIAPIYQLDVERGTVGFGFAVEGLDSPLLARQWAERALRKSLRHARVGAPQVGDDTAFQVSVCLEDHPTTRLIASDRPLAPARRLSGPLRL